MNNRYFFPALCIVALACAPACKKQQPVQKKEIKTMIELDNTVFETEETAETKNSIAKF